MFLFHSQTSYVKFPSQERKIRSVFVVLHKGTISIAVIVVEKRTSLHFEDTNHDEEGVGSSRYPHIR
jgi:hypothetical protein